MCFIKNRQRYTTKNEGRRTQTVNVTGNVIITYDPIIFSQCVSLKPRSFPVSRQHIQRYDVSVTGQYRPIISANSNIAQAVVRSTIFASKICSGSKKKK